MPEPASISKTATIQSVARALATIEMFFEEGLPLSLTEAAAKTGLAPASAHRLLSTLVKSGWLQQDSRSLRYALSERMLGTAAIGLAKSQFVGHGIHYLSRISEATGLSSYLAVQVKNAPVLLARVQGRLGSASDFRVGAALPMHASASGKLFLAFLPTQQSRTLLGQEDLKRITSQTIVKAQDIERELEDIRQRGYAIDRGELYESYRSVAVPVRKEGGLIIAALACGGWSPEAPESFDEALLKEMIPAAEEFSRVFGQYEPW